MHMKRTMVIAAVLVLGACTSSTIETEPVPTETTGGAGSATAGTQEQVAHVGDAIELSGMEEGLEMRVELVEVVDPAKPANRFLAPGKRERLVAVRLRLTNIGQVVYSDSPSNGAVLVDRDDHEYDASLFDEIEPALGNPKIAPGDSREGFITFVLPKDAEPRLFQFTLNSGFGPETGQWEL